MPVTFDGIETLPVNVPEAVGENRNVNSEVPFGTTVVDVRFVLIENAAAVPAANETFDKVRLALPVFVTVNVRLPTLFTVTGPKSAPPAINGVMGVPTGDSTLISGARPVPVRLISKGSSSPSLLAMWIAAVRMPEADGVNVTVKVVFPEGPATGAVGFAVMLKSPEFVPSLVIVKSVRLDVPRFLIVKFREPVEPTNTDPKDFELESAMSVPAGCSTAISGAKAVAVKVMA